MAGVTRAAVTGNLISTDLASGLSSTLTALITVISDLSKLLVIASYVNAGAPRPGGPVYFPVTSAVVVDRVVDSMRSRKPGVGT